jgi:hypothetical protein
MALIFGVGMRGIIATALTFSLMGDLTAHADPKLPAWVRNSPIFEPYDPMYGKIPDKEVKNWIRFVSLLPRSGPSEVLLFSPQKFDVSRIQKLILLPTSQYNSFARYTARYRCQAANEPAKPSETLEVTKYSNGRAEIICRMSFAETCAYLRGIPPFLEGDVVKWVYRTC